MKTKELKTKKITFRTTDALGAYIQKEAEKYGQSASEYIESCIQNPSVNTAGRMSKLAEALICLQNKINTLDKTAQDTLTQEVEALWQSLN